MRADLVFVYNADSGLFNTLSDMAHKVISPATYECNLCALTYGTFGMRDEWRTFLEKLGCGLEFLHRNELVSAYGLNDIALPAIFIRDGGSLRLMVSAAEINACDDMAHLKRLIETALQDR